MHAEIRKDFYIEPISLEQSDDILCYLLGTDNSLVYASPSFISLISLHLKVKSGWLVARDQASNILGILPYSIKHGKSGPVYNSFAYYGSNGGVIQQKDNPAVKDSLIQEFYILAEQDEAVSATIITNPLLKDYDFYEAHIHGNYLRDERIGQVTHLPESSDDLISIFDDPRPRNIRRAQKEGFLIQRRQDKDALEFLYQTHLKNLNEIGGLAKDYSFFQMIPDVMPQDSWAVYTTSIDGEPVAALLLFYFNQTVEYFTPAIIEKYRNSQPLALIIYSAMQDAIALGFKNWNWGGTWLSQGGVYDFKKRWGTSEYPYYYYTKVFKNEILKEGRDFFIKEYSGFYVVPFSALSESSGATS